MKQSTKLTWRIALVAFFAVLMIFFIACDTNAVETVMLSVVVPVIVHRHMNQFVLETKSYISMDVTLVALA